MRDEEPGKAQLNRRSFIKTSAGVAAGAAAVAAPAVAIERATSGSTPPVVKKPSPTPQEPIVAYLRDARRGEITVVSGTTETTYRDVALANRLVAIATPQARGTERGR